MSRIRVLDLAKELGIETKVAIAKLQELGVQVKNHFNAVSDTDAAKLRAAFSRSSKTSDKDTEKKPANKIFIRRKTDAQTENVHDAKDDLDHKKEEKNTISIATSNEKEESSDLLDRKSFEKINVLPLQNEEVAAQITPQHVDEPTSSSLVESKPQEENKITAATEKQERTPSQEETENKMETKQPISPSAVKSSQQQPVATHTPAQPPSRPAPTGSGAVIVRRADPKDVPQRPAQSSSPGGYQQRHSNGYGQRSDSQYRSNDYRSNNGDYRNNNSDYRSQNGDQRNSNNDYRNNQDRRPQNQNYDPQRRPSGDYNNRPSQGGYSSSDQSQSRPYHSQGRPQQQGSSSGGYNSGGQRPQSSYGARPGAPAAKPFSSSMISEAPVAPKDTSSRFKDRDKDREKRKAIEEEELRQRNAARKGSRFHENETLSDVELDGGFDDQMVRTIIPNRKKAGSTMRRKEVKRQEIANPTKASKKIIRIDESISVNDLAGELSQKATAVIKTLMKLGMMANINQQLDFDTATFVAQEFGFETQNASVSIDDILTKKADNKNKEVSAEAQPRPPIITIMGHVDHGKTSLLDAIRSENVASKEAGGITQHIGAYQIDYQGRKLTFLDTPGHEAFTSMRARGAQVTDIVVLVVAADDGVMPQTIEAIAHSKAAGVPIIVAINKIDKPGANFDRITKELADQNVMPEEWGGESMFVKVSAKTHDGLSDLIEAILLQADVLDLKVQNEGLAEGIVIEARLDKARGPVATLIVTKGLLKQQDSLVAGKAMGRVRALFNDRGQKLTEAGPSTPVELIGLDAVPQAGDKFNCVANDTIAKEAVAYRAEKQRQKDMTSQRGSTMEDLLAMIESTSEKPKELSIIIKADTHGSSEAIKNAIQKLDTPKVKSKIILSGVGGITETDSILAKASQAIIVGFNVRPDRMASQYAERAAVKIQSFSIIYELLEFVQASMLGTLAPTRQEKVIGHAEVRNTFSVPKVGIIAGCMITDGKINRSCQLRIVRDGIVIYTGKLGSLKRFKDDAKEVAQGFECGISVENYNDLKVGDVLEAFIIEEIAATLN